MADIQEWYRGIPLFTRTWFSLSVGTSVLGRLLPGILSYYSAALTPAAFTKLQLWRLITATFYYPIFSPSAVMHYLTLLYFMYQYTLRMEAHFNNRHADFAYMLLICWAGVAGLCLLVGLTLLMEPLVMAVIYVWCQYNKDAQLSFFFGTRFRAAIFPWIMFAFHFVLHQTFWDSLIGIAVGHFYFFMMEIYPRQPGGSMLLYTPDFVRRLFPGPGAARPPGHSSNTTTWTGGHAWGRGNTLRD